MDNLELILLRQPKGGHNKLREVPVMKKILRSSREGQFCGEHWRLTSSGINGVTLSGRENFDGWDDSSNTLAAMDKVLESALDELPHAMVMDLSQLKEISQLGHVHLTSVCRSLAEAGTRFAFVIHLELEPSLVYYQLHTLGHIAQDVDQALAWLHFTSHRAA